MFQFPSRNGFKEKKPHPQQNEELEYPIEEAMLAATWCILKGRRREAEKLLNYLKAAGYPDYVGFPAELETLVKEADTAAAAIGDV